MYIYIYSQKNLDFFLNDFHDQQNLKMAAADDDDFCLTAKFERQHLLLAPFLK